MVKQTLRSVARQVEYEARKAQQEGNFPLASERWNKAAEFYGKVNLETDAERCDYRSQHLNEPVALSRDPLDPLS